MCFNGGQCRGGYSQMCACRNGFQGPRCQYGKWKTEQQLLPQRHASAYLGEGAALPSTPPAQLLTNKHHNIVVFITRQQWKNVNCPIATESLHYELMCVCKTCYFVAAIFDNNIVRWHLAVLINCNENRLFSCTYSFAFG